MSKLSNDPQLVAQSFLEDTVMAERASYLARGRRHQALTNDQVRDRWETEFKGWVTKGHLGRYQDLEDINAEQNIRGMIPAWERVTAEKIALEKLVKERIHNPSLLEAIDAYLKRRNGGN